MPTVTSRQNPLVARYREAARGGAAAPLLLDGIHLVLEALVAGLQIEEAAITTEASESPALQPLLSALGRARLEPTRVSSSVMDAISPVKTSSPVVALARRPDSRAAGIFHGERALALIAADVQDPGNLGAMVRVAEAAGASGVVAAGASADPFGWKALRGSMGSALRLPVASKVLLEEALASARAAGCRVIATSPRGGEPYFAVDLRGPLAIVIGGEGPGLPSSIIEAADIPVTIPMQAPVESLNAAVTAALVLYEARRQRT